MTLTDDTLIRAEDSVLGGLMLDSTKLPVVEKYLDASDFQNTDNRHLFGAIKTVIEKGFMADPVSLNEHIQGNGELLQYVATLAAETPSAANIESYCEIVRNDSEKRKLKKQLTDALKEIDVPKCSLSSVIESLDSGIEKTRKRLLNDSSLNIKDSMLSFEQLMQADIPERKKILPWLPEGGLVMVSALRGLGKTNFGISLGNCIACGKAFMRWEVENPTGVLYVDGEMSFHEFRERVTGFMNDSGENRFSVLSHETFFNQTSRDLVLTNRDIQQAILC